ncbi:hypothetical protein KIL84_018770 [Mauremys mutica]|uniref:Uncharacterized protein n=1 Tax=Mauremys mutica TaxID=74926 RepID=A0A9D3XV21_9SAUR|nr:hypothetical protein KIL84_018770 [Mauremys mutica]
MSYSNLHLFSQPTTRQASCDRSIYPVGTGMKFLTSITQTNQQQLDKNIGIMPRVHLLIQYSAFDTLARRRCLCGSTRIPSTALLCSLPYLQGKFLPNCRSY